jgi:two-component system sensor histidine kinase and response regulator WspE
VDDLLRSLEKTFETQRGTLLSAPRAEAASTRKRVLVVDDSITVREVERNLLELMGYDVDVAVDGVDGWHAVRRKEYDLIVSDLDMPRMDGFELVAQIKSDPLLRSKPVIVVSYKDREEDRLRALSVGADFFLTKGSFQDETFNQAVLGAWWPRPTSWPGSPATARRPCRRRWPTSRS